MYTRHRTLVYYLSKYSTCCYSFLIKEYETITPMLNTLGHDAIANALVERSIIAIVAVEH